MIRTNPYIFCQPIRPVVRNSQQAQIGFGKLVKNREAAEALINDVFEEIKRLILEDKLLKYKEIVSKLIKNVKQIRKILPLLKNRRTDIYSTLKV